MKKVIKTDKAPAAIGMYSQAVATGHAVFTSGNLGIDPSTGKLVTDDFKAEARQVMTNMKNVLEAGDSGMEQVIKTLVFMTDLSNFAMINEVYAEFFPQDNPPARSAVQVSALPLGANVEIEAIALTKEADQ